MSEAGPFGSSAEYGSAGSCPAIARRTVSQSAALRAIGPSLSRVHDSAMAPSRDTRPKVGRNPEMPQNDDGQRIDPQVSDPMANGIIPEPTAAPAPDDEPQVQRAVSHGLRAAPVREASPLV